ncbi:MAG: AAA family ATPase, partial [Leptospira sp.]|nr:AAA family ATPase [Leptospira sp.]
DAIANSGIPVIVISSSILGTINHSLLTLEALKSRKIPVLGFFVYGETNDLLENNIETIRRFSGAEFLGAAFVPETISDKKEFMAFAKNMFDSDAKLKRKIFP